MRRHHDPQDKITYKKKRSEIGEGCDGDDDDDDGSSSS